MIIISGLIVIFCIVAVLEYFKYKKQLLERIIANPEDVNLQQKLKMGNEPLLFGLLFVGIAMGCIFGGVLNAVGLFKEEISYITGIFLFGGIALMIGHFIEKKK